MLAVSDINISHGNAGIFDDNLIINLLLNLPVKEF